MSEVDNKITASFLFNKLRVEGVLLLAEVRDAGGHSASRSLDAMSYGLWPSKGSHATGYEIKINRQDWLKELQQIEKAEAFRPYCKYFYLVADKKVAELHEIPETWGFLEWNGRRLVTVKAAPVNNELQPFPPSMLSAIFKRAVDTASAQTSLIMNEQHRKRNEEIDKKIKEGVEREFRYEKDKINFVNEFFEAIGLKPGHSFWGVQGFIKDYPQCVELIKDIITFGKPQYSSLSHQLQYFINRMGELEGQKEAAERILAKVSEFEKAEKEELTNV